MNLNPSRFFALAAVVCFAVALLAAVSAVHSNENAWIAGGLLSLALSWAV